VKVLVTGSTGQLGRALLESVPFGVDAVALTRTECDFSDPEQCRGAVLAHNPSVLVNAAAYTLVDKANTERDLAFRVNADAPGAFARAMGEIGGRMVQVSTDFVFNGAQGMPYAPDAACHPLNVYGASKRAGEEAVLAALGDSASVVRTSWVYSSHGSNFVKTMLRLMATRDSVSVVADQVGSPTWARSLARMIWLLVSKPEVGGVLHFTDDGVASWYDFAVAIQEEALARGILPRAVSVLPITAADYARQFPAAVPRPPFSVLEHGLTRSHLGLEPVHWRTHLREMLDELKS